MKQEDKLNIIEKNMTNSLKKLLTTDLNFGFKSRHSMLESKEQDDDTTFYGGQSFK